MKGRVGRRGSSPKARADERGGAVSLWVVLMVPVSAFAAVVAMAGPQRLAAESSVNAVAEDLAVMAIAWRDGHRIDEGPLPVFPPECVRTKAQQQRLNDLDAASVLLNAQSTALSDALNELPPTATEQEVEGARALAEDARVAAEDAERERDLFRTRLKGWEESCERLFEWITRDLGRAGVNTGSLRGYYTDSLTAAASLNTPGAQALPCRISERAEVRDAVHVALAADWEHSGWAAAQVWPQGVRMAAESIGRLHRTVSGSALVELCRRQFDVLDDQGRPVWLTDGKAPSRGLSQSVPSRTVFEG